MNARLRAVLALLATIIGALIWFAPPRAGSGDRATPMPLGNGSLSRATPASEPALLVVDAPLISDGLAGSTDVPRPEPSTTPIPPVTVPVPTPGFLGQLLEQLVAPMRAAIAPALPTQSAPRTVEVMGKLPPTPVLPTPRLEPTAEARTARVPILMYHYVSPPPDPNDGLRIGLSVTPAVLEEHFKFFKEHGWHAISLNDLYAHLAEGRPLPPKPVVLTFDDGYLDAYTAAFPLLKKYGHTATFFIFSGAIGFNPNYLTWSQIQEMSVAGMSIESHTYTHPDMRNRSDEFLQKQIRTPIDAIAKATGKRPRFFAYPAGQFDANTVRVLQANDTLGAVTTRPGMIHKLGTALVWDRVRVTANMPVNALVQAIGN